MAPLVIWIFFVILSGLQMGGTKVVGFCPPGSKNRIHATFVLGLNNMDVLNRYVSKIKPSNLVSELDSVAAAAFPSSASLSSLEAMVLNFRGR